MRGKNVFQRVVFAVVIIAALTGFNLVFAQEDAKILYFPALNENGEKAEISLTNNGDIDDALIIRAYDENSTQLNMLVRTLEAGATDKVDVKEMPEDTATVTVEFNGDVSGNIINETSSKRTKERSERRADYIFGHPTYTRQNSSCLYNVKTCADTSKYHTAVDYSSYGSTDVISSNSGKIAYIEYMSSYDHGMGNNIIVEHELTSGSKIYSSYSHLASITSGLKVGDTVSKGQKLGVMGGSGYGKLNYWGVHLHFEIKSKPVTNNPSGSGLYWGYTPSNPDNYGYYNPNNYIGKISVKTPVTVKVTSPNASGLVYKRGNSVSIKWTSSGASSSDKMTISMKRDSYSYLTYPDNVNWYRFTEYEYNDGSYTVTIPSWVAIASDWRFYVRHNNSDKWDSSDYTITVTRY